MMKTRFTDTTTGAWAGFRLLLVAGVTALTACSSGIIPNYAHYDQLTTEQIAADFKRYARSDGSLRLAAPWVVELVGWLNEHEIVDNQAQKLIADYRPEDAVLNLHAQLEYTYTVPARRDFVPAEFDRVRINEGRLLLIESDSADRDCDQGECTYSQKLFIPLTVAEVVGSRYSGLSVQLIDPGKPVMEFRLPDTYVRAFSEQAGVMLARYHTDFDRVADANARLDNQFGRDQLAVEDMAGEWQCDRSSVQALELDAAASLFQIECENNRYRLVRCELGQCTVQAGDAQ